MEHEWWWDWNVLSPFKWTSPTWWAKFCSWRCVQLLGERVCTQNSVDPDSGTGRASKCSEHLILRYAKQADLENRCAAGTSSWSLPKSHQKISRRFEKFRREKRCDEYLMLSKPSKSTNEPQSLQEDQLMPWLLSFPGSFLQAHRVSMYIYLFVVISYPGRSRIMNCVRQGRWIWDTREQCSKEIKVLLLLVFFPHGPLWQLGRHL